MEALERNMLQPLLQHVLVPLEVPQVRQVQVQVWPGGAEVPQGLGRCWRADCRGRLQDYEARILSCSSVKVLYRLRHVQF